MTNPYNQDFFIRHRQLRESADNVVFIHAPRCQGKSWTEMLLYIDDFYFKRTKLLRSKSKQSRIVSVVCK